MSSEPAPPPPYQKDAKGPLSETIPAPEQPPVSSSSNNTSGFPGVVGGTSQEAQQGYVYAADGSKPQTAPFVQQQRNIEQSLGPTCQDGQYHHLRMQYTNSSLFFALILIPYLCGWRGKRLCTCTKCGQTFPSIILPEP